MERIVTYRKNRRRKRKKRIQYLVKWSGYGYDENTWKTKTELADVSDLLKTYWDRTGKPAERGRKPKNEGRSRKQR